jgi:hypothetical protein
MQIIFDLSGTVFGALDYTLRPGMRETIAELRYGGNTVDFWTSGPTDHYRELLRQHNVTGNVYTKSTPLHFTPDVCVDDSPEGWMPGRVVKVETYVAEEVPVEAIDPRVVLAGREIGEILKQGLGTEQG